eukprot:COSAG04_NODE_1063_length_8493_cov_6.486181_9_plen_375_part_00
MLAAAGYFSPLRRPRDARGTANAAADAAAGGDDDGRVRTIHRYPVKSCGGEQLDEVRCDRLQPLPGDRAFMWVDAESKFITQRPHEPRQGNGGSGVPAMATIQASYGPDGSLRLAAPADSRYFGLEPLDVAADDGLGSESAPVRRCTLFSGEALVSEQAESAGAWFGLFAGASGCSIPGSRLVKSHAAATTAAQDWRESRRLFQRQVFPGEEEKPRPIPLDDGGTILLVSQGSLDLLNTRLQEQGLAPVPMSRFRPNFVLDNLPPHAEDGWLEVEIGEVRFRVERPCTRCTTVLVDQGAGVCDGVNWLTKVLAPYRLCAAMPSSPKAPLSPSFDAIWLTNIITDEACGGTGAAPTRATEDWICRAPSSGCTARR